MLKVNIKVTNIELTPAISDYISKKLVAVEKYIERNDIEVLAQVEVGKNTQHHRSGDIFRAEVHLVGAGIDAYAVSEQDDLYAAIDLVKDEILHNLTQTKGKEETLARRGARFIKSALKGLSDNFKSFKKRQ